MFSKIRQVVNYLTAVTPAPAAVTPSTDGAAVAPATSPVALVPTTDTLDAAVAPVGFTSNRAELFNIKVVGLDDAKKYAVWLTKGLDRTQPATAVRLVDCTSDHLKNIVLNKPNLSPDYLRVIESILEDRGETLPDNTVVDPTDDGFDN
jgi:hypothetical protein